MIEIEKKSKFNVFIKIFVIFMIGSILGYIVEMIVGLVQNGRFVSRQGLIYGPFTPVYGIGILVYYLFFSIINTKNKGYIFIFSMILGGITEYLCSYIQEKVFGTVSWDYSNWIFNINGRTTLIHCTYWGLAGLLYTSYIKPLIPKIEEFVKNHKVKIIAIIASVFMLFNITISSMAAIRQNERVNNIPANGNIDMFLDKAYPDKYMDEIFENKKVKK